MGTFLSVQSPPRFRGPAHKEHPLILLLTSIAGPGPPHEEKHDIIRRPPAVPAPPSRVRGDVPASWKTRAHTGDGPGNGYGEPHPAYDGPHIHPRVAPVAAPDQQRYPGPPRQEGARPIEPLPDTPHHHPAREAPPRITPRQLHTPPHPPPGTSRPAPAGRHISHESLQFLPWGPGARFPTPRICNFHRYGGHRARRRGKTSRGCRRCPLEGVPQWGHAATGGHQAACSDDQYPSRAGDKGTHVVGAGRGLPA